MHNPLWSSSDVGQWSSALAHYEHAIAALPVARMVEHDVWYRTTLGPTLLARTPRSITHEELVRLTEWKMSRGVWRAPNLVLVRSNAPDDVVAASQLAAERLPQLTTPVGALTVLKGVGAATASALLALLAPELFPFFDEHVAAQVPALGPVAWTTPYYHRYAAALRERATSLVDANGPAWTPVMVERALWATHVLGRAETTP